MGETLHPAAETREHKAAGQREQTPNRERGDLLRAGRVRIPLETVRSPRAWFHAN